MERGSALAFRVWAPADRGRRPQRRNAAAPRGRGRGRPRRGVGDDWHHHMRRLLAGDCDGYYESYSGTAAAICDTIDLGWFFRGQWSSYHGASRHRTARRTSRTVRRVSAEPRPGGQSSAGRSAASHDQPRGVASRDAGIWRLYQRLLAIRRRSWARGTARASCMRGPLTKTAS